MNAQSILELLVAASGNAFAGVAVKATFAVLAALALLRAARGASASSRHLMAAATFALLLFLPIVASLAPVNVVAVPARLAPPAPKGLAVSQSRGLAAAPSPRRDPAETPRPRNLALPALYAIYFGGVALSIASLLGGLWRVSRLRRAARVSVTGTRLANEMARSLGRRGGIEVVVSSELAVPITFGSAHPVILLPAATADWSEEELRRAIRHEIEHIARGDWATQIVSRLALAVYWPHPLVWMLWSRLRLEAERACDDAVIRAHTAAESYAEQLVALAQRLVGRGRVPALAMATRSNLGRRVEAILDGGLRRAPLTRRGAVAATTAAIACLLALAPFRIISAPLAGVETIFESEGDADPLDVALLNVAKTGDVPAIERLLSRGAKANAAISGDGSPLIAAAQGGHLQAMATLIRAGADVNLGVSGDGSPLIAAAQRGNLDAVRLLLDHGAKIDKGVEGDGNALIMASGAGQTAVVQLLLDRGAGIEVVVPGDENPLIHASETGATEVVRLLIARGANVNARVWADFGDDRRGEWRTPLVMARRGGHEDVVRILVAAGAK